MLAPPSLDRSRHFRSSSSSGSATDCSAGLSFGASSTGTESGLTTADEGAADDIDDFADGGLSQHNDMECGTPKAHLHETFNIPPMWHRPYSRPRSGTANTQFAEHGNDTDDESDSLSRIAVRPKSNRRHSVCLPKDGNPRSPASFTETRSGFKSRFNSPRLASIHVGGIGTPPASPTPSKIIFARGAVAAHAIKTSPSLPEIRAGGGRGSFLEHRAKHSSLLAARPIVPNLKLDLAGMNFALAPGETFKPFHGVPVSTDAVVVDKETPGNSIRKATPYHVSPSRHDGMPGSLSPMREMSETIKSPPADLQMGAADIIDLSSPIIPMAADASRDSIFSPRQAPSKPLMRAVADGDDAMSPLELDLSSSSIMQLLKACNSTVSKVDGLPEGVVQDNRPTPPPMISARRVCFASLRRPIRDSPPVSRSRPRTPGVDSQIIGFRNARAREGLEGAVPDATEATGKATARVSSVRFANPFAQQSTTMRNPSHRWSGWWGSPEKRYAASLCPSLQPPGSPAPPQEDWHRPNLRSSSSIRSDLSYSSPKIDWNAVQAGVWLSAARCESGSGMMSPNPAGLAPPNNTPTMGSATTRSAS